MTRCTIYQGRYGAPSPKPTNLLFVGPSDPRRSLRQFEAKECSKGVSIGLEQTAQGRTAFQTSKLKEYPGGLCRAIAQTLKDWIAEHNPEEVKAPEEPSPIALTFLEDFRQQLDTNISCMGPDFNTTAKAI